MENLITCVLPYGSESQSDITLTQLKESQLVRNIVLFVRNEQKLNLHSEKCSQITGESLNSSATLQAIAQKVETPYILIYTKEEPLLLGYMALQRMVDYLQVSSTAMVYADHYRYIHGVKTPHPLIDYQEGSVRDDFDFGSVLLFKTAAFQKAAEELSQQSLYHYSALYAIRLSFSRISGITHIREYLYTEQELDTRLSGEKQFDYVDPKNRQVQIEREAAFTYHLKQTGAYLPPVSTEVDLQKGQFIYEASVIIPVYNRVRTIKDAISSALNQQTSFPFNVIVIDNHSTDGTTEAIRSFNDNRILHLIPERDDLGIGGCWNLAIQHNACGRFAVQLDSDDLYSSEHTLQKIVDKFYETKCAMVIGTYQMTNFQLNPIPPGIIDHSEWTDNNGHNNALRINGLGAPRAFFTPVLRDIRVPNTSYGEDYALGLAFSRQYKIGRLYEVLYLCRRWEGNSDAALSIEKVNKNNAYKDSLRTLEIQKRKAMN